MKEISTIEQILTGLFFVSVIILGIAPRIDWKNIIK